MHIGGFVEKRGLPVRRGSWDLGGRDEIGVVSVCMEQSRRERSRSALSKLGSSC